MTQKGSRSLESGFSLMEMLVGLTLLALISVAVTQSVRTGLRLWQAAEANDADTEWQQTEWLIQRWLARAVSPMEFPVDSRLVFEANSRGVRFVVDGQVGRKPSGYSRIGLFTRDNANCPGRSDLVLSWEDVTLAGGFASEASDERVLLECLEDVRFEYETGSVDAAPEAWTESIASGSLPNAVRVKLTAGGKPRLIAARLLYAR